MDSADSVYARRPWNNTPEPDEEVARYDYMGPYTSDQAMRLGQALSSTTVPSEYLADLVRPPLPQVQLFRSRYGYRTRELGISDIMDIDEIYLEPRVDSGGNGGFEGTSRNSSGNGSW